MFHAYFKEISAILYIWATFSFVSDVSSTILQGPRDKTIYSGSTVSFHCTSDGLADIYWKFASVVGGATSYVFGPRGRNDKRFDERFVKTVNGSTSILTISNVRQSDAGGYICRDSTSSGHLSAQLTIIAVYALSQVKVIQVGSSVKFTCDTTDVADLEWDFSPTSYPSKSRIVYEYPNVADRFKWRHSVSGNNLSINNVQLCDAGNYKCIFPIGDNLGTDNFQLTVFGGPVICERNNRKQKRTAHCHVNHSSNIVPVFSCPSQSASARREVIQVYQDKCPPGKILYNITTFSVHTADNVTPVTCKVRYTAVGNSTDVYYEEECDVFGYSTKQESKDSSEKGTGPNEDSEKPASTTTAVNSRLLVALTTLLAVSVLINVGLTVTVLRIKGKSSCVKDPTYQRANASRHEADRAVYTELTIVTPN